jgi:hypothetical protein
MVVEKKFHNQIFSYEICSYILAFFMELWLKRLGALYNKYKNTVQLVGS